MIFKLLASFILLGVVILVVLQAVDVKELHQELVNFPKLNLTVIFALSLIISLLKAWRFSLFLKNSQIKIDFLTCLKVFIAGQAVTPLPGGEAARGVLLKKKAGINLRHSTGPILAQAYMEVLVASFMLLLGSFFIDDDFLIVSILVFLSLVLFAFLIIYHKTFNFFISLLEKIALKYQKFQFLLPLNKRLIFLHQSFRENVYDSDSKLLDKTFVRSFGLTFVSHLVGGFLIYIIVTSYQVDLNIFQTVFLYSGSIIIQSLASLSPGGLGFTEGGLTGILMLMNISFPQALSIVIIFRVATLVFSVLTGLLIFLVFFSKDFFNLKKGVIHAKES